MKKEGNVLFTVIWCWMYGKGPYSERGNLLPPLHRLLFRISRSSQCSTTGVKKAVVCAILSVGWCI